MRTENRNSGKQIQIGLFFLLMNILFVFLSCIQNTNSAATQNSQHALNVNSNNDFIANSYLRGTALASIINVSTYEERSVFFELNKETDIQIYAVGEAGVYYMEDNSDHLFKSDNIEFYFDFPDRSDDVIMNQEGHFVFNFSWLDGAVKSNRISFFKQGCEYHGYYDSLNNYVAEIKFPWQVFNIKQMDVDTTFGFDLVIGDNDDGMKQTGKLAWHSRSDNLMTTTKGYGKLSLTKDPFGTISPDTLLSRFGRPVIDGEIDKLWNTIFSYPLNNMIMGLNDPMDLSATVKTFWDKESLYFLVNIHDQSKKHVRSKSIRNLRTMSDFGWIEDDKGNKIWETHIRDAQYAGGAQKNRKFDQVIHLPAGKYNLKYASDESHAWNNWDDKPPNTPFYGIIIYKCK